MPRFPRLDANAAAPASTGRARAPGVLAAPRWLGGIAAALSMLVLAAAPWWWPLPHALSEAPTPSRVIDRYGRDIAIRKQGSGVGQPWGEWLPLATLAAEDHRFEWHPGIDATGIARALAANVKAKRIVQGGSTIDQQLARRLVPRNPGWLGKLAEAARAVQLRAVLGSDGVLDHYLARTWYGNGCVGAGVAAFTYFGRPVAALSLAQAATLAAIPRRPADIDPFENPALARQMRDRVLARLRELAWISADTHFTANAEPLAVSHARAHDHAPHFVRRVLRGGETVATGLDLDLQAAAEFAVTKHLGALSGRNVHDAAVIVVHNPTRQVRAYVGSKDWDSPAGQVDMAASARSPGSALKPFLYARALERGHSLADLVSDTPGAWTNTHGSWSPRNYGEGSAGAVTLREALATSLNLPAVRLAEQIGTADVHRTLVDLGLTTLTERPDHYGLGLVLGDAEVRLDELAAAYAALASDGHYRPLRFSMDDPKPGPRAVFTPSSSFLVLDALDDANARTKAFGYESALEPTYPMAAKTGTSTGFRDNWAFGVTPQFTIGVWVGNADGSPMTEVSGITGAAPILRDVADATMAARGPLEFDVPKNLESRKVCSLSGLAAGASCPGQRAEWFVSGAAREACSWHDATGEQLPSQLAAWSNAHNTLFSASAEGPTVVFPTDGATFWVDAARAASDQAITLRMSGGPGAGATATWRVDGAILATVGPPWRVRWQPPVGEHSITVQFENDVSTPVHVRVSGSSSQVADGTSRE